MPRGVYQRTEKHVNKGCFQKGFIPWNKGLTKEDLRVALNGKLGGITKKGKSLKHDKQFKVGHIPHNKGVEGYQNAGTFKDEHKGYITEFTDEQRKKMRESQLGKKKDYKGKKHWNWHGGITNMNRLERARFTKYFQKKVLERDNFTCQICYIRGGTLTVDHIQSWAEYAELRFDMKNLRTLCAECHYKITFGKPMSKKNKWGKTSVLKGGNSYVL